MIEPPHELNCRSQVEADYTVIFFAAGARHNPGWGWVWKAYRSLNRKYRKNLKKLVSFPIFLVFSFVPVVRNVFREGHSSHLPRDVWGLCILHFGRDACFELWV